MAVKIQYLKVLSAVQRQRHRYALPRGPARTLTVASFFAAPMIGMARIDRWPGRLRLFFKPTKRL